MTEEFRKVEILKEGKWEVSRLSKIKKGDKFKLTETDGEFIGEFESNSDAFLSNNGPDGKEAWTVSVDNEDDK